MEQYIPKSALVAEIERKINEVNPDNIEDWHYRLLRERDIEVMKNILSLINSLEVKEVDLEKLVNDYFTGWYFDNELDILAKPNNYSATINDVKEIAKHFFELGMQVSNKAQKGEKV